MVCVDERGHVDTIQGSCFRYLRQIQVHRKQNPGDGTMQRYLGNTTNLHSLSSADIGFMVH